eukprot:COSAG03_NODE_2669_length_2540_cov_4.953707_4_plen_24_part_01
MLTIVTMCEVDMTIHKSAITHQCM